MPLVAKAVLAALPNDEQVAAEIAEDAAFDRIVATSEVGLQEETDWTCRVLAARL